MKPKTIQSFLRWTIFIFILFAATKKLELNLRGLSARICP